MAEIFVLGGGTPTPTAERFGSSHALKIGEELLMFDCGPAATHKLVKGGSTPPRSTTYSSPTITSTIT